MIHKLAFVFPGQGSQVVGMLAELAAEYPIVKETYDQASDILGYNLWQLVQNGPSEELNQTEKTQPALLVGSVAIWRIWQNLHGATPKFLAGHSLGEYTALVCANALNFDVAVQLVADRGKFMQQAVASGEGGMAAAIGLTDEKVHELCTEAAQGEVLTPANYNSVGQVVVAGHVQAIQRFLLLAKQAGAKLVTQLPVSVPSHCPLMSSAAKKLAAKLTEIEFRTPVIPVINNVDVKIYRESSDIVQGLVRQLDHPVRWVETVNFLTSNGIDAIIECGPGKILSGLNKRIASQLVTMSINNSESLQSALNLKKEILA